MQIFVQTDRRIIDLSKVTFMDVLPGDALIVRFNDGSALLLPNGEGAAFLDGVSYLSKQKVVVAVRAPSAAAAREFLHA